MTLMKTSTQAGVSMPWRRESLGTSEISRITPYRQRSRNVERYVSWAVLAMVTSSAASSEQASSPPTATAAASFGLDRSPLA